MQPPIPEELQRIIARCLRKRAEDRYPHARLLGEDLRLLRRHSETAVAPKTSWRQRLAEAWEHLRHLPPSRHAWHAAGGIGLGLALYLSVSKIDPGWLLLAILTGVYLYRHIRNRPHRVQELLVRRLSRIPEVRLIVFEDRQATVVVDRPVAQLYGRINGHLRNCNRKLYAGQPMTVSILHDVPTDQLQKLLTGPGVLFVRDDSLVQS